MITYKLHLIRHGQTEGNQKGLFVGRTDMPVSEEGFDELSGCGIPMNIPG